MAERPYIIKYSIKLFLKIKDVQPSWNKWYKETKQSADWFAVGEPKAQTIEGNHRFSTAHTGSDHEHIAAGSFIAVDEYSIFKSSISPAEDRTSVLDITSHRSSLLLLCRERHHQCHDWARRRPGLHLLHEFRGVGDGHDLPADVEPQKLPKSGHLLHLAP